MHPTQLPHERLEAKCKGVIVRMHFMPDAPPHDRVVGLYAVLIHPPHPPHCLEFGEQRLGGRVSLLQYVDKGHSILPTATVYA